MTHQPEPLALLRDTENYLSALHGAVARHDNLAANYGCAGCELRDRITAALPEITAAASAAVAPPTTHGLSVPHADALWDAVAIPGPRTPTYPEQHERVCRAVRDILDELTPAPAEPADRDAAEAALAAVETALGDTLLPDAREEALARLMEVLPPTTDRTAVLGEADWIVEHCPDHGCVEPSTEVCHCEIADRLRRMAGETATNQPAPGATALRAAADFYERVLNESLDPDSDPRYCTAVRDVVMGLRRRADETATQTPETPTVAWHILTHQRGTWRPWLAPRDNSTEAREDYDRCVSDNGHRWAFRLVRETSTFTVEAEHQPAAGVRQDGAET